MKRSTHKGFTLVELVVVIAIIGILAAILIPSMMGYVRKANKKADVATASMIGKQAVAFLTLNPEEWSTLHINQGRTVHTVTCTSDNGEFEQYYYRNLIKINGNRQANDTGGIRGYEWSAGAGVPDELKAFAARFTEETKQNIVGGSANSDNQNKTAFLLPMKCATHNVPGKEKTNRWLLGVRCDSNKKDTETLEVWAGDGGEWGNGPKFRLWPSPDREYLTGS